MKHCFTVLATATLLLTGLLRLSGQQPGHYSLYMLNKLAFNPAYAGMDNALSVTGMFRKQWVNLDGSPTTQNLTVHMPFYLAGGGIGLAIENDVLGASRHTSAMLAYNYQLSLGSGYLALGLAAGIAQRGLDGNKLRTPEGIYSEPGVIQHNDDLLPIGQESATVPTFDVGIYYQSEWLEIGAAARNITEASADFSTLSITLRRNYFATLDLHFELTRSITLHPSVLVRSDLAQTQTDVSLRIQYNDNIFGGASFRGYNSNSIDAVAILAGWKLSDKITLAYAYDLTLSDLNLVSNGSHELMLGYRLNLGGGRPPNIIYNPRSL